MCLLNAFDDVLVEPFVPDRAVIAFDVGVLLRVCLAVCGSRLFPAFSAHSISLPLIYSGPLSTRIAMGVPRHSIIWFRLRMTRSAGNEKVHLNAQSLAIEVVQNIQQAELPAVLQGDPP